MKCTQLAYDLDGGVFDVQTTTTYDPDGNVVSVIEENAINYLTEDDRAEPLVFGTDSAFEDEEDSAFEGRYRFDGLDIEVDDALQYNRARCFDPTIGRWLNRESLGFDASQDNLFRYPQ